MKKNSHKQNSKKSESIIQQLGRVLLLTVGLFHGVIYADEPSNTELLK